MSLKCGVVGLPNVGKSTLFNALIENAVAEVANYPFCTIEPNSGFMPVPDSRLDLLAKIANSASIIKTKTEIRDIAGLVKNASEGEGLGNKFLGHIRETDAIAHIVRCFNDQDVTSVSGSPNPLDDIDIINTELIIADMQSMSRKADLLRSRKKDPNSVELLNAVTLAEKRLGSGEPAHHFAKEIEPSLFEQLFLITAKPCFYVCNVDEHSASTGNELSSLVLNKYPGSIIISAALEGAMSGMSSDDKQLLLNDFGLDRSGAEKFIKKSYDMLNLMTFFTIGPKEARAWTALKGSKAPQAAGKIHTDMEKGFISADIIFWEDFINEGGESACKLSGKCRQEGRDYEIKDGDIAHFKFNV